MSFENRQNLDNVIPYSIDDSIPFENQFSYVRVGNLADGSSDAGRRG